MNRVYSLPEGLEINLSKLHVKLPNHWSLVIYVVKIAAKILLEAYLDSLVEPSNYRYPNPGSHPSRVTLDCP